MATVYGVNKTKARTPESSSSNIQDPGEQRSKVLQIQDTYEASLTASGTIIEMGDKLPKGARVIDVELMTDALGAGRTCIVGDYEDDNRYITATTCNTANLRTRLNAIDGLLYECDDTTPGDTTSDRQIIVTLGGGSAATGTIKLVVKYVWAN